MSPISLNINGISHKLEVEDRALLADVLRDNLKLTGTHVGCDTSQCGCCTILMDGDAVKSCTVLAVQANGAQITTIEGLAGNLCRCTGYINIVESVKQAAKVMQEKQA